MPENSPDGAFVPPMTRGNQTILLSLVYRAQGYFGTADIFTISGSFSGLLA